MNRRTFIKGIGMGLSLGGLAAGCGNDQTEQQAETQRDPEWLLDIWHGMSLEEKASQSIIAFITTEDRQEAVDHLIPDGLIGGVWQLPYFVDEYTLDFVTEWRDGLRARSKYPLIFCADAETGANRMCDLATVTPTNMALGATNDPRVVGDVARVIAREFKALGFHLIGSPVVDVNNNPGNVIINYRSFGDDPARVAAMAVAFTTAFQSESVGCTAKHFPGHGDTSLNSHLDLPSIDHPLEHIRQVELLPYTELIRHDLAAIMSAHIIFSAIDPDLPATLSKPVLTGLLREELGFKGVVISDEMAMHAIQKNYPITESVKMAINNGIDCVLTQFIAETSDAILDAVRTGEIPRERIEEASLRILRLKAKYGVFDDPPAIADARSVLGSPAHHQTALEAARRGIVATHTERIPLDKTKKAALVVLTNRKNGSPEIEEAFAARFPGAPVFTPPREGAFSLPGGIMSAGTIIVATDIRILSYDPLGGTLPATHRELLGKLSGQNPKPVYLIMSSPYAARDIPAPDTIVFTFGTGGISAQAGLEALYGELIPTGVPPVEIEGVMKRT